MNHHYIAGAVFIPTALIGIFLGLRSGVRLSSYVWYPAALLLVVALYDITEATSTPYIVDIYGVLAGFLGACVWNSYWADRR